MSSIAYFADRIFTGEEWLTDHAVVVKDGKILEVVPGNTIDPLLSQQKFADCIISPALVDLQIYGAYGRLFSVFPETAALYKLNEYCNKGGAAYCLPTVATNTYPVFYQCIDAVKNYWNDGGQGILGLHLEGPWINPVKRGAHIESMIHTPSLNQVSSLLEYGKGIIKMITLAPEICNKEIIELILSYDIVISAGHSNASYEQAHTGFASGITTVTHLYNAMSPLQHRAPGLVGAVMTAEKTMSSIIPDGYHVDYAAVRIAKEVMKDRLFAITDAVTETMEGPYPHYAAGDKYESGGILSGSALTMNKAVQNLVAHAGIELGEALRMCSLYPARVIRVDDQLGKIKKGYRALLSVFDKNLDTVAVIRDGYFPYKIA